MKKISEFIRRFFRSRLFFLIVALGIFSACSTTQFLNENESFYTGSEIKFETKGRVGRKQALERELEEFITPKPNGKVFGSRLQVWLYFKTKPPAKKKGLRNLLRNKIGQPPVLITDVDPNSIAKKMKGYLANEGYFKSDVNAETITAKKESKVIYTVELERPFTIDSVHYPEPKDSIYAPIIRKLKEKSLVKTGQRFQLARLQAEQNRIEKVLKDEGFYFFDERYLLFKADSTVGDRQVNLDLVLEKNIPDRAKVIYRIRDVRISPNYVFSEDSTDVVPDTTLYDGFVFTQRLENFRPRILTEQSNLRKGELYSMAAQELTLTHLMGLGTFKFVNIRLSEADSALLDADIHLTQLKKKSVRFETQAVSKSNNFVGPGFSFTFTNRNLMRGAELFQAKVNTSYEVQFSRQTNRPLNSYELGLETSLTIPRFVTPFSIDFHTKRYIPKTQIRLAYNLQNRVSYFRLNSFTLGYGYTWRETNAKNHELFPINITYLRTDQTSLAFDTLIRKNSLLAKSFENQFIIGTRYSYTVNTQMSQTQLDPFQKRKIKRNSFFFHGEVEVAGNLLNAVQKQVEKPGEDPFTLFGSPYSQYSRIDLDLRYYFQPDEKNKLATRLNVATGFAYGNSETMPYIKQFAVGGSNSVRAFPARSIGPGTYNARPNGYRSGTYFVDQRGDLKMEANVEYRFDVYKALKGAVFADAGNIWLLSDEPTRPGGKFDRKKFLEELAVGTGVGVRYDFSFFVFRLDVAFPLRKPWMPIDQRWVLKEIDFGSTSWRRTNLIFNIAIGYPF